jgi:uridine phosphorylase
MGTAEPVLIVAADRREFGVWPKSRAELLNWPVDFAAKYGTWLLVANGAGPDRAAEAVDLVLARCPVAALVSVGYCGALEASLSVADIVVATEVNGTRASTPLSTRNYFAGPIVSMDRVVQTVEEKDKLRRSGAIAVEMEAAGVAERASRLGLPFFCIRVVTDRSDETLTIAFNPSFLQDGLQALGVAYAELSFTTSTKPAVITGRTEADAASDSGYRYLIMPVRLSG